MKSHKSSMPMRHSSLRKHQSVRGFSLTEIAIALGTISVSMVALLGLVSVSLQTGQSSAQETCLASASRQALDALRSRNFEDLRTNHAYTEPAPASKETEATTLPTIYLSDDGQWLSPDRDEWPAANAETSPPPEAVYQCVVQVEPDPGTLTSPSLKLPINQTRVNLLRVKLELGPISGRAAVSTSAKPPTVLIHATLPRQ